MKANEILRKAAQAIGDRAAERDLHEERSMASRSGSSKQRVRTRLRFMAEAGEKR